MEVIVKQGTCEGVIGDCPFSHRVLLTLAEEGLLEKTTIRTVDLDAKPNWFLERSSTGKVPLLLVKEGDDEGGERVDGSGEICTWLAMRESARLHNEEDATCARTASARAAAGKLFPAFVAYVKSLGEDDEAIREERRSALLDALRGIEAVLQSHADDASDGTDIFLCGCALTPLDLELSPKLHHLSVVSTHYDASNPLLSEFQRVCAYLDMMRKRESWGKTHYEDALVIEGWRKHIQKDK